MSRVRICTCLRLTAQAFLSSHSRQDWRSCFVKPHRFRGIHWDFILGFYTGQLAISNNGQRTEIDRSNITRWCLLIKTVQDKGKSSYENGEKHATMLSHWSSLHSAPHKSISKYPIMNVVYQETAPQHLEMGLKGYKTRHPRILLPIDPHSVSPVCFQTTILRNTSSLSAPHLVFAINAITDITCNTL